MKRSVGTIMFLICALLSCQGEESTRKTIALFGITGVGKSTIANCLLNRRGQMASITNSTFCASEDSSSGTLHYQIESNEHLTVIDTIGFGSMEFNASYVLDELRSVLARVNNQLDLVIYVIQRGRLNNDTYQFIKMFQEGVLAGKARNNSLLLVNQCPRGWVRKPAQLNNPFLADLLASVNQRVYEFDLKWDHSRDDPEAKSYNNRVRQVEIDELYAFVVRFCSSCSSGPVNVSHLADGRFERTWLDVLFDRLHALARTIMANIVESFEHYVYDSLDSDGDYEETSDELPATTKETPKKKIILLVGAEGDGKSVIGNCLLAQRGDMASIVNGPLLVCAGFGGSMTFQVEESVDKRFTVIDSIGFDNNLFSDNYILDEARDALRKVGGQLDLVVYVVRADDKFSGFTHVTKRIIDMVDEKLFHGRMRYNSMLIVNKCRPGWRDTLTFNEYYHEIRERLSERIYPLALTLDPFDDDDTSKEQQRLENAAERQRRIDELVAYLSELDLPRVNISDVLNSHLAKATTTRKNWWKWMLTVG